MKSDLLYITFFLQPITCWYWTLMLEANVDELMLLYRCSSERNDFISHTSFFPASKGSSFIDHKQAAQQVEEAMTKAEAKTWSWRARGATWRINMPSLALAALRYPGMMWRWVAVGWLWNAKSLILPVKLWPRQCSVKPIMIVGVTSRMLQMWGNLGRHTTLTGNALQSM